MSDAELERRIAGALRNTPPGGVRVRDAVMSRVRALPAADRPVRRPRFGVRAVRHSVVGAALAASVGSVATLSTLASPPGATSVAVIGDSAARQVVAMVDDGRAMHTATPMRRESGGRWSATIALRDGAHRYAFVVDATRWVADPSMPRVRAADGRLFSLLQVAAKAN